MPPKSYIDGRNLTVTYSGAAGAATGGKPENKRRKISMTFLPKREADLMVWSGNFNTRISADPTIYGLTIEQAADYATLHTAFAAAYTTANEPMTRTPPAIQIKNDAMEALIEEVRSLVNIVQGHPGTTNGMRRDLGITVPDTEPTPVPPPEYAPGLDIVSTIGRTVHLRLYDSTNPERRGRPDGVDGATVLTYLGATPPAPEDLDAWKFEGNLSRTATSITFPPTVDSGATAWFTAFWFNPRKQSGPAALPISTQIPGSLPQAA